MVVDLLAKVVLPEEITGLLVNNAHTLNEATSENFILRLYRNANSKGFVKGFSDDAESLKSGFGKVDRLYILFYDGLHVPPFRQDAIAFEFVNE